MTVVKRFLSYVEIQTKITSIFAFLMTLAYLLSAERAISLLPTLVFFGGMLCFDMTATTINNYNDTRKNHQTLQFRRSVALLITLFLFSVSAVLGIYLFYLTDFIVLLLGGLCFLFGVFYSYGPVPISHGPYGELFSGIFYGLLIPFILVYINTPSGQLLIYSIQGGRLIVELSIAHAFSFLLLSAVPFSLTANIMLANNICDLHNDMAVGRFTLPYYLKKHSLTLFSALYYLVYLSVILMVIMRLVSPLSLLLLFTIIPVQRNINTFYKKQLKEETFIVSIKNYVLIMAVHTVLIFAGGFLPGWAVL